MEYLIIAFGWFLMSIAVHILLNKLRLFIGIPNFFLLGIFVVGLVGCLMSILWFVPPDRSILSLPATSILLYCSLSLAWAALTASPTLGDESPTTTILMRLLCAGPQTEAQLMRIFTYEDVVGERINNLIRIGWVKKRGRSLIATKQGNLVATVFFAYRRILGLSEGG